MANNARLKKMRSKRVNAAVAHSISRGKDTGTGYVGLNPVYAPIRDKDTGLIVGHRKVSKGVPFVSKDRMAA